MNALTRIWIDPRGGIKHLAKSNRTLAFITLAPAFGIVMSLRDVMEQQVDRAAGLSPASILLMNMASGAACGLVGVYLGSYMLTWVSRLLGGRGSAGHVRTVLAWPCLPCVPLVAILIPLFLFAGDSFLFREGPGPSRPFAAAAMYPPLVLYYLLAGSMGIWGIVINLVGLSEVMALSIGKSIAATILSVVGMVVATTGIIILMLKIAGF